MAGGRLRGRRRWVAIAAGLVALYALAGFFVVPRVARKQIVALARTQLHREARVARVTFNPFTLAGSVEGLELADRDGAPLLGVRRVAANLELSGIFRRAWRFGEIAVEGPSFEARILADGKPSLSDLFAPSDATAPAKRKAGLPRLIVDRLALRGGRVTFVDESRSPRFAQTFEPLDLEVRDLATIPEETGDHAVTVGLGGAVLRWTGRQTIEPLHLQGHVAITGVSLERLGEIFAPRYPLMVSAGRGDVGVTYDVARGGDGGFAVALSDGSVTVRGAVVRARDASETWLEIPSAEVAGVRAVWPDARAEVASVRVLNPKVLVRRDAAGRLNWTSALPPAPPAHAPAPAAAKPWSVAVAEAAIEGGEVTVDDLGVSPGVRTILSDVGVHLANLSSDPAAPVKAEVKATIDGTGRASVSGTVVPRGPAAHLAVSLAGLDLTPLQPYAAGLPGAEIRGGRAALEGALEVSAGAPRVRFDGTGSIDALHVAGAGEDRLVAWDRAQAGGVRATFSPDRLRIAEIRVDGAFLKLRIDRVGNVNLSRLRSAAEGGPPSGGAETAGAGRMPVDLGRIVFHGATADYTDESLILPFGTKIHDLHGDIRDVSTTAAAPARLAVEGRVAEAGYVKADGTLRVSDPLAATDVSVIFRNVDMPELTPYTAQFAGYSVQKGVLDVDVRYRVQDRHLVGDHHVVAKDLVLGPKVEGAPSPGLPVRLAIALLKDKDGRIDLEVPIEGTVDAPEFNYRSVFWQAFKTILANVAKAPFRAIGRLFGADKDDLDLVGFPSGRSDLPAPERETLAKLAAELAKRPELALEIEGRFDPVSDAAAIRQARLEAKIDAKRTPDTSLDAILEALYAEAFSNEALEGARQEFMPKGPAPAAAPSKKGKTPPPAPAPRETFDAPAFYESLRTRLLEAEPVGPADLAALARARAASIAAALTAPGGLDPARVAVADPAPVKRKRQGSDLVDSQMTMSAKD